MSHVDATDQAGTNLHRDLRDLIAAGPMVHLSTINADGSPQVSVIWVAWTATSWSPVT